APKSRRSSTACAPGGAPVTATITRGRWRGRTPISSATSSRWRNLMSEFSLAGRGIGVDQPPLVIAEVGINHEGDVDTALELVDSAAAAGAELLKFQCHITEKEMVPTDMTPGEISKEKLWDIIKRCELTAEEERRVQARCAEKGLIYLSTPFSREAA